MVERPSPDGRLAVQYRHQEYAGVGPARCVVQVVDSGSGVVLWSGGTRIFNEPLDGDPWSGDSARLALVEWRTHTNHLDQSLVILYSNNWTERHIGKSDNDHLRVRLVPTSLHAVVIAGQRAASCWFVENAHRVPLGEKVLTADAAFRDSIFICDLADDNHFRLYDVVRDDTRLDFHLSPDVFTRFDSPEPLPPNVELLYLKPGQRIASAVPPGLEHVDRHALRLTFKEFFEHPRVRAGADSALWGVLVAGNWDILAWDRAERRYLLGVKRYYTNGVLMQCYGHYWMQLTLVP